MRLAVVLTLLALASPVASQASVQGLVTDATGVMLPGANVYLSGTTRGTATDAEGVFLLDTLAPGAYRVVASMLGFETQTASVVLAPGDAVELAFEMAPATRALGTVEVGAERDRRWMRRFEWFRTQLIGESENAEHCTILNPHVLTFRSRWGTTTAAASEPLVIENRALGYRLTYDLTAFEGSSASLHYDGEEHFDELVPSDSAEAARWRTARASAYRGSMRHLFHTLRDGTTEDQNFALTLTWTDPLGYRASFGMPDRQLDGDRVARVDSAGWATVRVRGQLGVRYHGEPESPAYLESGWFQERRRRPDASQHSSIELRAGDRIDPQGTPEDPFAFSVSGYMAFERLADLLPADYEMSP